MHFRTPCLSSKSLPSSLNSRSIVCVHTTHIICVKLDYSVECYRADCIHCNILWKWHININIIHKQVVTFFQWTKLKKKTVFFLFFFSYSYFVNFLSAFQFFWAFLEARNFSLLMLFMLLLSSLQVVSLPFLFPFSCQHDSLVTTLKGK